MLNPLDYTSPQNIWNGISHYIRDHFEKYQSHLPISFTDDDLLKALKKSARKRLLPREYDTFRKAVTSLRNGTTTTLKHENLYRLCFVLNLDSDEAQDLLLYYLHFNELSARSLDEFIIISSLKLRLSWEETCEIRSKYHEQIQAQPVSPSGLCEGQTKETYHHIIHDKIQTVNDLWDFLDAPENMNFFAKTRNTQYLTLFDDVNLEVLYNGDSEQIIRLVTNYDSMEKEPILEYYHSLFGLLFSDDCQLLTDKEISSLSFIFENVFMNYDNFRLLVQRKRPTDISSGTFMLGLLKKLLTEDSEKDNDFYINFLDEDDFIGICNDILIYFGFPTLNPECDNFDRLLLDVYRETLKEHSDLSNSDFQDVYLHSLRDYLRLIANL